MWGHSEWVCLQKNGTWYTLERDSEILPNIVLWLEPRDKGNCWFGFVVLNTTFQEQVGSVCNLWHKAYTLRRHWSLQCIPIIPWIFKLNDPFVWANEE